MSEDGISHSLVMSAGRPASIQVQSVLYKNKKEDVLRALTSLERAADLAIAGGFCSHVSVSYGDGSPIPCLSEVEVDLLRRQFEPALQIRYNFFDRNLGSALGHNTLAHGADADFLLILNPDVIVSPTLFGEMLTEMSKAQVGMVEAKQLPIEHPKAYDYATGETSWATTACALIPVPLFEEVGGFDYKSFFLYCDDVDFSWLIREKDFRVIHQPRAVVFHDKRLSPAGEWQPSAAEQYYSAEAALMLTHKWSRHDLLEKYLSQFSISTDKNQRKAAETFLAKKKDGELVEPRDLDNKIGQFVGFMYAPHRYSL